MPSAGFLAQMADAARQVDVFAPREYPESAERALPIAKKRQAMAWGGEALDPRVDVVIRRDRNGLLMWDGLERPTSGGGKRASWLRDEREAPITLFSYERPKPNEFVDLLEQADAKCNEKQTLHPLYKLTNGNWERCDEVPASGRVLLFIHGTFSNNDAYLTQFRSTDEGRKFLDAVASAGYDAVLGFEHPTLAVSPICNAIDLNAWMGESTAEVDVIAHSRGGLVTRWWMEHLDAARAQRKRVRAVLVGSPLAGTSLASPPSLVESANRWLNIVDLLHDQAPRNPAWTGVMTGLFSMVKIAGATAAFDAVGVLVPGLAAQSTVSNNVELTRLNGDDALGRLVERAKAGKLSYYTIRGDYESSDERYARMQAKAGGLAKLEPLFKGPHDLVVDKASMNLSLLDKSRELEPVFLDDHAFPQGAKVFHTNYFEQAETLAKIREWLNF